MNLPVQREPVQRSIVGLARDNRSFPPECVTSGATVGQGIEPSSFGLIDDIFEQQKYLHEWSLPNVARPLGSLGI